jgi:two-component system, LytTR family, response regulator
MNNNQQYNCVIIDDEDGAIQLLLSRIKLFFKNLEVSATFTKWEMAYNYLQTNEPDIIFMDISMPGTNGIRLLKMLPHIESEIIFITAYAEYALSAFEFTTSGYIVKPIDDTELVAAINKSFKSIQYKRLAKQRTDNSNIAMEPKIGIPDFKGIEYVNLKSIIYFEAAKRYVKVVTVEREILSSYNIGKFKALTEKSFFYQVHRSYILNLNYIERYEHTGIVVLHGGTELPVAKNLREDFLNIYGKIK